jgi:hypothetical protein
VNAATRCVFRQAPAVRRYVIAFAGYCDLQMAAARCSRPVPPAFRHLQWILA